MPTTADTRHNSGSEPPRPSRKVQSRAVSGTIFYTPRSHFDSRPRPAPTFPTPHIRPRQRRPHKIHIVSYPPGYIPSELRSILDPNAAERIKQKKARTPANSIPPLRRKRARQPDNTPGQVATKRRSNSRAIQLRRHRFASLKRTANISLPPSALAGARVFEKLLAAFSAQPPEASSIGAPIAPTASRSSRPNSFLSLGRRLSLTRTRSQDSTQPSSGTVPSGPVQQDPTPAPADDDTMPSTRPQVLQPYPETRLSRTRRMHALSEEARIVPMTPAVQLNHSNNHRNSFISIRSNKNAMTSSVTELADKPLAAAGGMAFDIVLAEPHVFLTGFDHGRAETGQEMSGSVIVRGKLTLTVTKNVKIRGIIVKLQGKARTEWPEGLPPFRNDHWEEESLRTMNHTCFNAMHGIWGTPYGDTCSYNLKNPGENAISAALSKLAVANSDTVSISSGMSAKDIKRLSLQQVQQRSFGKDDSPNVQASHAKGYKVFYPGTYEYPFEFPIDHHQLETINLPFASVKWELEGCIERAGAFKPNLHGAKEVSVIRVPDQMSLETVEPISISRQWEDQLHYDIVVSGKSFPIGGKIPIAFKLTPLAKVQLHKLKVYITESSEYWTSNKRVTRRDAGRKILLFEKTAGRPLDPAYGASEIHFTSGGEPTEERRIEARAAARHDREREAERTNIPPEPLPEPTPNMLGDLDLGLESFWGATELEMNVQMPTCKDMANSPNRLLHPDSTWRNASVYHWIKVVLRISRIDPEDPEGKRRRHFEISIDSPFTILSCLATQANTALPQYSGRDMSHDSCNTNTSCGCYDAADTPTGTSPTGQAPINFAPELFSPHLSMPQAAHLHSAQMSSSDDSLNSYSPPTSVSNSSSATTQSALTDQETYESPRPIHLLRVPSYAPPAFDADDSPPLPSDVMTPPPNYDIIVGTPSVDGLADYFSRLANYNDGTSVDDSDSDGDHSPARITSRGGRVNVPHPRTPGGLQRAPSRSMDIQRPMVPFNLHMARGLRPGAQ